MAPLERAARSRSEADWIVGMNATRAATIRLRSSFDGAVSLGRVQTPDAGDRRPARGGDQGVQVRAILARRCDLRGRPRADLRGALPRRAKPRIATEAGGAAIVRPARARRRRSRSWSKKEQRERAPLLYDLTSLQREANTRYGFSAKRTLAAAQRCYEEHKALTYPRTSSRYLTKDMIAEIKPTAELVGMRKEYAKAAQYVVGLDLLPLGRVVNDAKVSDHHAIIPTRSEHDLERMGSDDRRIYDMVARRFLAVFHPEAVFENTRVESDGAGGRERGGSAGMCSGRTAGCCSCPAGAGCTTSARRERGQTTRPRNGKGGEEDEGADQQLPRLEQGERVQTREIGERTQGNETAAPLQRRFAAGRRWRRPASWSTTTSCARR